MFAGAAFTDSADIKVDTEVVDTLVSLGVVNGYDDGSFKPNGTVTRAEMAKMIYVLRTGNSDASAYNEDHLGHFRTGNDLVRLVRTIGVTGDYAQRRKHVHSVSSLNVGLIRERCTSKHGECASKRQYQCKNLFEIRVKISKLWYNS